MLRKQIMENSILSKLIVGARYYFQTYMNYLMPRMGMTNHGDFFNLDKIICY